MPLNTKTRKSWANILENYTRKILLKNQALHDVECDHSYSLHKKKLKSRGYNQSEWFAKGLSTGLSKQLNINLLERHVKLLLNQKEKYQRWENVENIFSLNQQSTINEPTCFAGG